jgi:hypothetical protein
MKLIYEKENSLWAMILLIVLCSVMLLFVTTSVSYALAYNAPQLGDTQEMRAERQYMQQQINNQQRMIQLEQQEVQQQQQLNYNLLRPQVQLNTYQPHQLQQLQPIPEYYFHQ